MKIFTKYNELGLLEIFVYRVPGATIKQYLTQKTIKTLDKNIAHKHPELSPIIESAISKPTEVIVKKYNYSKKYDIGKFYTGSKHQIFLKYRITTNLVIQLNSQPVSAKFIRELKLEPLPE